MRASELEWRRERTGPSRRVRRLGLGARETSLGAPDLLTRRYHEVLEHGPAFDQKPGAAPPGRKGK